MSIMKNFIFLLFVVLFKVKIVRTQCEFTTYQNLSGFYLIDSQCCKGIAINNLCSEGDVCCYGRYDCSGTDSSELTMFLDSN
jgi:hypothetical protein